MTCPRLFEAEAMRDGRLGGAEQASFVRHTTVCSACGHEVERLEALAAALRASSPHGASADELHTLRERTRLIASFDRELLRTRPTAWRRILWPATAAALVTCAVLFWRTQPAPAPSPAPSAGIVVHPAGAASWSRREEGGRERIVLERGELWIHVDHAQGQPRVIVALPDGELEDTGTTFTVSAADGRTTRIAVQEGSVVLRIRGKPPVAIGPGETWDAGPRPGPQAAAPAPVMVEPVQDRRTARARRSSGDRSAGLPAAPDPAMDFRAAVAVLDAGANRQAAAAFARFLVEHPRDPRAEDAAYLRVIALQRSSADEAVDDGADDAGAEMTRAAREYLRLYPTGFRRVEMERLSR